MERSVNFYDLEQTASVDFNKQWWHAERAISIEISARHCTEKINNWAHTFRHELRTGRSKIAAGREPTQQTHGIQ
jgi:hypothetical protein